MLLAQALFDSKRNPPWGRGQALTIGIRLFETRIYFGLCEIRKSSLGYIIKKGTGTNALTMYIKKSIRRKIQLKLLLNILSVSEDGHTERLHEILFGAAPPTPLLSEEEALCLIVGAGRM